MKIKQPPKWHTIKWFQICLNNLKGNWSNFNQGNRSIVEFHRNSLIQDNSIKIKSMISNDLPFTILSFKWFVRWTVLKYKPKQVLLLHLRPYCSFSPLCLFISLAFHLTPINISQSPSNYGRYFSYSLNLSPCKSR